MQLLTILIVAQLFTSNTAGLINTICATLNGLLSGSGSCFADPSSTPQTWSNAESQCINKGSTQDGTIGRIAQIADSATWSSIQSSVSAKLASSPNGIWIGLQYDITAQNFRWMNTQTGLSFYFDISLLGSMGVSMNISAAATLPCVKILSTTVWATAACSESLAYFCELVECKSGYVIVNGLCVLNLAKTADFTTAAQLCASKNATLPVFHSSTMFNAFMSSNSQFNDFWIGATSNYASMWTNVDLSPYDYSSWASGYPKWGQCAYADQKTNAMKTDSCGMSYQYNVICIDMPGTFATICPVVSDVYHLQWKPTSSNNCLRYLQESSPTDYVSALKLCDSVGGRLPAILSSTEYWDVMRYAGVLNEVNNYNMHDIWLGVNQQMQYGIWQNTQGNLLSGSVASSFWFNGTNANQPNNFVYGDDAKNDKWLTDKVSASHHVVCEYRPAEVVAADTSVCLNDTVTPTYYSTKNITLTGTSCIPWLQGPTATAYLPKNYCRNVNLTSVDGPWCYTSTSTSEPCFYTCFTTTTTTTTTVPTTTTTTTTAASTTTLTTTLLTTTTITPQTTTTTASTTPTTSIAISTTASTTAAPTTTSSTAAPTTTSTVAQTTTSSTAAPTTTSSTVAPTTTSTTAAPTTTSSTVAQTTTSSTAAPTTTSSTVAQITTSSTAAPTTTSSTVALTTTSTTVAPTTISSTVAQTTASTAAPTTTSSAVAQTTASSIAASTTTSSTAVLTTTSTTTAPTTSTTITVPTTTSTTEAPTSTSTLVTSTASSSTTSTTVAPTTISSAAASTSTSLIAPSTTTSFTATTTTLSTTAIPTTTSSTTAITSTTSSTVSPTTSTTTSSPTSTAAQTISSTTVVPTTSSTTAATTTTSTTVPTTISTTTPTTSSTTAVAATTSSTTSSTITPTTALTTPTSTELTTTSTTAGQTTTSTTKAPSTTPTTTIHPATSTTTTTAPPFSPVSSTASSTVKQITSTSTTVFAVQTISTVSPTTTTTASPQSITTLAPTVSLATTTTTPVIMTVTFPATAIVSSTSKIVSSSMTTVPLVASPSTTVSSTVTSANTTASSTTISTEASSSKTAPSPTTAFKTGQFSTSSTTTTPTVTTYKSITTSIAPTVSIVITNITTISETITKQKTTAVNRVTTSMPTSLRTSKPAISTVTLKSSITQPTSANNYSTPMTTSKTNATVLSLTSKIAQTSSAAASSSKAQTFESSTLRPSFQTTIRTTSSNASSANLTVPTLSMSSSKYPTQTTSLNATLMSTSTSAPLKPSTTFVTDRFSSTTLKRSDASQTTSSPALPASSIGSKQTRPQPTDEVTVRSVPTESTEVSDNRVNLSSSITSPATSTARIRFTKSSSSTRIRQTFSPRPSRLFSRSSTTKSSSTKKPRVTASIKMPAPKTTTGTANKTKKAVRQPLHTMNDAEFTASVVVQTMGCTFIIGCLVATLVLFMVFRNFTVEKIIVFNEDIALLVAHVLILTMREPRMYPGMTQELCTVVAIALQYFFTAAYTFMTLEALQMMVIVGRVKLHGALIPWYINMAIGWGVPLFLLIVSTPLIDTSYSTTWTCWGDLSNSFNWLIMIPLVGLCAISAILLESAGMIARNDPQSLLGLTDSTQLLTSQIQQRGIAFVMSFTAASHIVGVMAVYFQIVYLYVACFFLNVATGVNIFTFHTAMDAAIRRFVKNAFVKIKSLLC